MLIIYELVFNLVALAYFNKNKKKVTPETVRGDIIRQAPLLNRVHASNF
ncbi:hypothetical protein CAEBREN_19784 [Caenorhabditis brenneri]|uniref:Uncharacterized protein n=1 Tax=Caenorhabditis brenneri TaxID=135651 RepID=G0M8E2_CAEBE|nr:hypothetical protein CAEBREN_19784 [Caenorhabditis brenneri]